VSGYTSARSSVAVTVTTLTALSDDFYYKTFVNEATSWQIPTILTNDTFSNNSAKTITLYTSTPPLSGITVNAAGLITFPSNAVAGTAYEIPYTITQNGCTSNTAIVTVRCSDPTFRADGPVWVVDTQENAIDSERKIIVSGEFSHYNKVYCRGIARLNNDLTLDPTFKLPYWFNLDILDMKVQPNNKILIAGVSYYQTNTNDQHGIMRLNADGSIDDTFNNGLLNNNSFRGAKLDGSIAQVTKIFVLPEGSSAGYILVAGYFNQFNGYPTHSCILLNPDGSYDPTLTFNQNLNKRDINSIIPDTLFNAYGFGSLPYTFAYQRGTNATNWKIIAGGEFANYQGVYNPHLLRLNADGSLDSTFGINTNNSSTFLPANNGFVNKIIVQTANTVANDKIIVAGKFNSCIDGNGNNVSRNNLMRLNANGTLDATFNVGNGFSAAAPDNGFTFGGTDATVKDMFLDTTDPTNTLLYICGRFTSYSGSSCDEMIRIKCGNGIAAGSLDQSFDFFNGGPNGPVYGMKLQYDVTADLNKIIIGGNFTSCQTTDGTTLVDYITRISPSGSSTIGKIANDNSGDELNSNNQIANDLILYPNPSSGKINFITFAFNEKPYSIYVYNPLGQKVFEKVDETAKESAIDLSDLKTGTYFITFTNNQKTITKTIILK
jgi:uncharacterized delta-60 repeat protein